MICTAWWISLNHSKRINVHDKFIPYTSLKSRRKYQVIHHFREFLKSQSQDTIDYYKPILAKVYKKERYIRCEPKITNLSIVIGYISRYIYRPPIAQSRITDYDGENITIQYEHKQPKETRTTTFTWNEFLWALARHIPEPYFHTVHYGWMFAPHCKFYYLDLIHLYCSNSVPRQLPPKLPSCYRQRMITSFWIDPLQCPCCKTNLTLQRISYNPITLDSS